MSKRLLLVAMLSIGAGCTCVDDPRQGGLLGYCPDAYKQRIAEREGKIQSTETEEKRLKDEGQQLGNTKAAKQKELMAQKQNLTKLDKELVSAQKNLVSIRARTQSQVREKQQLQNKLAGLEKQITALQNTQPQSNLEVVERQKRIEQLRTEIEQLTEIIVNFAGTSS